MPNYCNYSARIKGEKKNVLKLAEWLEANYYMPEGSEELKVVVTRDGVEVPTEHHIGYRVFDFWYDTNEFKNNSDTDVITLHGDGDCAWSVYSCMFNGAIGTYMGDRGRDNEKHKSISIDDACGLLGVTIEIFSTEPGCCFAEHYLIDETGEVIINDETEYTELYLGDFDTDDYDEYSRMYKEEYDEEPYVSKELFETAVNLGLDCMGFCEWWDDAEDGDNQFNWPWEVE